MLLYACNQKLRIKLLVLRKIFKGGKIMFDMLLKIDGITTWGDLAGKITTGATSWIGTLLNAINWILWIALILVGACGAVYAIYVGVKMARADSSEQREEAKKRLINIIVSIVVTIALILFFNIVLPVILNEFDVFDGLQNQGGEAIRTIINIA